MNENLLFTANKPCGISCNKFLSQIKKKYGIKKAGYSGTLDVNASGVLIIAFGQYTKLFRFLKKTPKKYTAVLWLGAKSESLDAELIENITELKPFDLNEIHQAAAKLIGQIKYIPPKFSAKRINGKRAYDLARAGKEFELKEITTEVFSFKIKNYEHPFVTFEAEVSEGGYIRSLGAILAASLGIEGCLKSLQRESEGEFKYENEKPLLITNFLDLEENFYEGKKEDLLLGRVLQKEQFKKSNFGEYFVVTDNFLSVVKIDQNGVDYILNKIEI
ncbi:MAG: tRNA pseudouridine(55) synthase TruB [Campylobacteraceae bacterium]|nr:tRNA pseudouridine(55) synthase TruB [Campylobacteraceae bacterium]